MLWDSYIIDIIVWYFITGGVISLIGIHLQKKTQTKSDKVTFVKICALLTVLAIWPVFFTLGFIQGWKVYRRRRS